MVICTMYIYCIAGNFKFGGLAVYLCNRQFIVRMMIQYRTTKFKSANIFAMVIFGPKCQI